MYSEHDAVQSDDSRRMFKFAQFLSTSDIIPDVFKNKPANVLIACQLAQRMNVPAMEVMQNIYVVHGNPTFKTSYLIARANESGIFTQPIQYEISGGNQNKTITAYSYLKCSGKRAAATVSMEMAHEEGWTKDNRLGKSKYRSMPEHMLCFRAAAFLIRRYAPQISLGFQTKEEIDDTTDRQLSAREKLNLNLAQNLTKQTPEQSLALEDQKFKLEHKELQLNNMEVMDLCQE